jgi:hypothetical protein|uniref:Uncharacterized protein n=1 Tax=viral metagenome TaxID=1070528 RepID=A0A6C0HPP3_9ZZZZ
MDNPLDEIINKNKLLEDKILILEKEFNKTKEHLKNILLKKIETFFIKQQTSKMVS